jgi:transposase
VSAKDVVAVEVTTKWQKNDAADAEAICEAVVRPNRRLVEAKTLPNAPSHAHLSRANRMRSSILSAHIWPSLASWRQLGATASRSCSIACRKPHATAFLALGAQLRMLKAQIPKFDRRVMAGY